MSDPISSLVQAAQKAYLTGDFQQAISLQQQAIAEATRSNLICADHYLALCMYLFEATDFAVSLDWLQRAASKWPRNADIAENMGILLLRLTRLKDARMQLERAIELGSTSLNVLDALCHCHGQLNEPKKVQYYGRKVLEAKHERSLAAGAKYALPSKSPPIFASTAKGKNVISYSLWGDNPRYFVPLLENLKIAPHLFPSWTIRVYFDRSVPTDVLKQLKMGGAALVDKSNEIENAFYQRLLWRFEVANDSAVQRFLIRDADSLLTVKERIAVDEWLISHAHFHVMRDSYTHTDLMLAGLWGGAANVLPRLEELWSTYHSPMLHGRTADQRFLGAMVWPTVSQSCLIHDSIFTGCLGSVPFPRHGDLLPGRHIGQNAYAYFRRNS
jgi:hypothetical protein